MISVALSCSKCSCYSVQYLTKFSFILGGSFAKLLQVFLFLFLSVIYSGFWPKYGSKSLSFHYFGSNLMSSLWRCLYLYRNELFSQTYIDIILFHTKICQDWMSSSWVEIRSTFQNLQNPYYSIILANIWWRHCDIVFSCIVTKFFKNSPLYYLTPHRSLLRFSWSEK